MVTSRVRTVHSQEQLCVHRQSTPVNSEQWTQEQCWVHRQITQLYTQKNSVVFTGRLRNYPITRTVSLKKLNFPYWCFGFLQAARRSMTTSYWELYVYHSRQQQLPTLWWSRQSVCKESNMGPHSWKSTM